MTATDPALTIIARLAAERATMPVARIERAALDDALDGYYEARSLQDERLRRREIAASAEAMAAILEVLRRAVTP